MVHSALWPDMPRPAVQRLSCCQTHCLPALQMLLVMDYMEGGPVMTREALERGRCIPEPLALQYFRDMCKVPHRPLATCPATHTPCCLCGCQAPDCS